MIDPTEADIGRTVRYTPEGYEPGLTGEITGLTERFVWVQWGNKGFLPMPLPRGQLSWEPSND